MRSSKSRWLIVSGVLLLIAAAALFAWNKYTEYQAGKITAGLTDKALAASKGSVPTGSPAGENTGDEQQSQTAVSVESLETPESTPNVESTPTATVSEIKQTVVFDPEAVLPVVTIDGLDICGIVEVPDLELTLTVVNTWSYDALKQSPCRFVGSPYADNLVLLAHNYDTHFGRLKMLSIGAPVCFTDMAGNVFRYEVALIEDLKPTQFEAMTMSDYPLMLFTCTVGGRSRMAVRCVHAEE